MNKLLKKSPLLTTLLLVVIALLASACQTSQKGRKPSENWSRSVPVGFFVRGDVDMVTSQDGGQTHQVWLQQDGEQRHIQYLQLDEMPAAQVDRKLDISANQLRRPLIELASGSNLHLLWSSRSETQREWDLQIALLDQSGDLIGEPLVLATADQDVKIYDAAPDGEGGLYVVWSSDTDGALYGSQISSAGQIIQEPRRLVQQGKKPFLARTGTDLHLAWWDAGKMLYGVLPGGKMAEIDGVVVTNRELNDGQTLDGPVLGVSGEWVYVLWSIFSSSGLHAGTAVTEFVTFPENNPGLSAMQQIFTSTAEEQPYVPYDSAYQISQLAPPVGVAESSDYVYQPHPVSGRGDELAVAVALNQERRLDMLVQPGLLLFKDGQFVGYQMAGKTEAFSQAPVLAGDANGNLYMAWREGGQGSVAQYALTTPVGRDTLDRVSSGDVANVVLGGGIEVIAGILFFPLAGIWILPGFLIFGLWNVWRGDDDRFTAEAIVALLLAIVVSQVVKFSFLPLISAFVPFSAWFDIAPLWEDPLRILVPILTMGIALAVAFLMRRRNPSPLIFFFWFMAVDAVLTLAVYGVSFLGA